MRNIRSVCSTTAALHRVFIAPFLQSRTQLLRHSLPTKSPSSTSKLLISQQRRNYAAPPEKRRLPRDDEITAWSVSLVTADGKLQEPRNTSDVLASIDRKEESLVVVMAGEPGVPPICKIMNKKAMWEEEKARAKAGRNPGAVTKTLELNWAIDPHDLGHRLLRLKEFLGKGFKVEVVMAAKRKGRKATTEEAQGLVDSIREAIGEVAGARVKRMEGEVMGQAVIFAEGTAPKER